MRRSIVLAVCCGLALLDLPVRGATTNQQATFRVRTDVVSVNVSVKQNRRPVTDLTAADFTLTDNGVAQTIDALSLQEVPIDLTVVLTGHNVVRFNAAAYSESLINVQAVRQSLRPSDRLRVIRAQADIRGFLVRDDAPHLMPDQTDPYDRQVTIIDAIFYGLAWPLEPDRRHVVVAFTDGFDRWSTLEPEMLTRLAGHADAVLHVVYWERPSGEASRELLSEVVQRTGGALHRLRDARHDLAAIVEDFRTSYVLQYRPRGIPAAGWHEIRVRINRPGRFDVRARKGYQVRN